MAAASRKRAVFALVVVILLGIFLPPNINGNRFSKRLAATLSAGLGREVRIGSVNFRLLPRPGFDLYDFAVLDEPRFSAEPLLMCGKVAADLRLTSLWEGRLEIANLKLQNADGKAPPSLNLVYTDGHWNLESLLLRAEQVPTAPTAKKSAEQRSRFPYIEADAGRINMKVGPEKKPYALTNTDFALWLASENQWHVRLEGRPVRTDMNLSDTGVVRLEGDVNRSSGLRQSPVKMQFSWEQGQLGQLASLVLGQDKGWRGGLNLDLQLLGSLEDLHITAHTSVEGLRRYDIDRNVRLSLDTQCLGEYGGGLLDFNCNLPANQGALRLNGKVTLASPRDYDLSLVADRLPLSAIATFARQAKRTLPDDLDATGTLDASFQFRSDRFGTPEKYGKGATSELELRSASLAEPIAVSPVHFSLGLPAAAAPVVVSGRKRPVLPKPSPQVPIDGIAVNSFTIQLGKTGAAQAQGNLTATGYAFTAKGTAPLVRVLDLGRAVGFPSHIVASSGSTDFDLTMSGAWANFAPASLGGAAKVRDVEAVVPGFKSHLLLSAANAQFTDAGITLTRIAAQFQHSEVAFTGAVSKPLNCEASQPCAMQFDVFADRLSTDDLASLLGSGGKWNLPLFSSSSKLPEFRAAGTLRFDTLKIGRVPFQEFSAHAEVGAGIVALSQMSARIGDGTTEGNWRIDWNASPLRYSGSGTLTGVSPEHLEMPLLTSWITGKSNVKYTLNLAGNDGAQILRSASGQVEFAVNNGVSQALTLDASRPTKFQNLQGSAEMNRAVLKLITSKFKAENRIYIVSGTVSLADKQARLTVSDGANHWDITGALDKPNVAAPRPVAQEASAHVQ
jgi:AsmA protein